MKMLPAAFLLVVTSCTPCLAQGAWGVGLQASSIAPTMEQLQQQIDEARQKQANDVTEGPEAVQNDQTVIDDLQEQQRNKLMWSGSPGARETLEQQQNAIKAESQQNAAQADAQDDDERFTKQPDGTYQGEDGSVLHPVSGGQATGHDSDGGAVTCPGSDQCN